MIHNWRQQGAVTLGRRQDKMPGAAGAATYDEPGPVAQRIEQQPLTGASSSKPH
jgi:hypothetical protein